MLLSGALDKGVRNVASLLHLSHYASASVTLCLPSYLVSPGHTRSAEPRMSFLLIRHAGVERGGERSPRHTRATRNEKFREKWLLGLLSKAAARRKSCS